MGQSLNTQLCLELKDSDVDEGAPHQVVGQALSQALAARLCLEMKYSEVDGETPHQVVGQALSQALSAKLCLELKDSEVDEGTPHQYQQYQPSHGPPQLAAAPQIQLALRVEHAPIKESLGAKISPFEEGDEIAVVQIERLEGWEPLGWRQERVAKQSVVMDNAKMPPWPEGQRFSNAKRFWGARVISSDGKGGFEEHWCMLQVGVSPGDRTMESVKAGIEDSKDVASYAHRFNEHTARAVDADPEEAPGIRVCAPVGCWVLASAVPELVQPGEAVSICVYPAPSVQKFVFDGREDFVELPQAFFHYVAWLSGSQEMIGDLQGIEDDNDVLIVDPVVLRTTRPARPTIGGLLGVLATPPGHNGADPHFDRCHPKCGQLCQSFDPHRRGVNNLRRHCGLNVPSCGVPFGGA